MSVCFYVPAEQGGASNESDDVGEVETVEEPLESPIRGNYDVTLAQFWVKAMEDVRKITVEDFKTQVLPLARIKKIMKLDEEVKMISAEAPMLFAKAAEIFIHELTLRAWVHTEDNKRRTLQRNDIAMAISKSDQFDFLIDIVPRHEVKPTKTRDEPSRSNPPTDQVQYYFQLAQQHQAALQTPQQPQIILQPSQMHSVQQTTAAPAAASTSAASNVTQQPMLVQQIVSPSGEVQQVPIQLTQAQLNMLRMQLQTNSGQPIIIQAQQQGPQIIQVSSQGQPQPQQQVYLTQVATQEGE